MKLYISESIQYEGHFKDIAQAEAECRLMVFHLKEEWWNMINEGRKKKEYRDEKWSNYLRRFIIKLANGNKVYIELDKGYPAKMDFRRKMFFEVNKINFEMSLKEFGGDGENKWAIHLGEKIL